MKKTKLLIVFGGQSSEHDVSLMSAKNVYKNVDADKFDVSLMYINPEGQWFTVDDIVEDETRGVSLDLVKQVFVFGSETYRPDVIFPVLHGKNGEDGMLASLGQLLNLPVVGPDMTASSVSMDKLFTKQIVAQNGVLVAPYRTLRRGEKSSYSELAGQLSPDLFVKPTRAGSSVGVSKVQNQTELDEALNLAFRHDDMVLIEQNMKGREVEVSVLGNGTDLLISPVGEILVAESDEFYSYDSKYADDSQTSTTTKAEIPPEITKKIQDTVRRVYTSLRCGGLSRVDCFLVGDEVYLNEINTLPGFTNISMYPKLIEEAGLDQKELISRLVELAIDNKL